MLWEQEGAWTLLSQSWTIETQYSVAWSCRESWFKSFELHFPLGRTEFNRSPHLTGYLWRLSDLVCVKWSHPIWYLTNEREVWVVTISVFQVHVVILSPMVSWKWLNFHVTKAARRQEDGEDDKSWECGILTIPGCYPCLGPWGWLGCCVGRQGMKLMGWDSGEWDLLDGLGSVTGMFGLLFLFCTVRFQGSLLFELDAF